VPPHFDVSPLKEVNARVFGCSRAEVAFKGRFSAKGGLRRKNAPQKQNKQQPDQRGQNPRYWELQALISSEPGLDGVVPFCAAVAWRS
jgi:hypothetical protein